MANNVVQLKKADPNSKLAVEMLKTLGAAFENYENVFDNRSNKLQPTGTLQYFQEKVNYPAHNLFMTANKYVKSPTKFMEQLLLNECLKHTPYTRLNDLHMMISDKWFLKQAEHANYRLPDVENIRMHIYNVMKELVFSHFICMAVQDEPVEGSAITDTVRSTVTDIIDTIDKQLQIIENSFFPDYVVKEVKKLIEETTLPENDINRRITIAEVTLNMLRKTFGPGIIIDSKNHSLFVRDYEVQVNKYEAQGKMPPKAIVNIKAKHDYYVTVTRADRFDVDLDFDPDTYVKRLSFTGENDQGITFPPELFTEDVLAVTWFHRGDRIIRCPKKSVYPVLEYSKSKYWGIAVTGAYLDKPINPTPSTCFELKKEQEMAAIQDIRIAVQAELIAIKETNNSCSSVTTQWLLLYTITKSGQAFVDVSVDGVTDFSPWNADPSDADFDIIGCRQGQAVTESCSCS
uniref:Virion structural protein n=1 Tax=Panagrellus redivivus TaxID=6233 RepID=A0A7E4VAC7_PANRE